MLDYGAIADGKADDTDAFNRATRASEAWGADLEYAIDVPPGRYRIAGTVYVRKGQSLLGVGYASVIDARGSQVRTFALGSGIVGGKAAPDPGGAPVSLSNLLTIGGSPNDAVVFTDAQGFSIQDLFMTGPGIGIEIAGADGLVGNIIVDQGLNGIILHNCQNIILFNIQFFVVNYAMTIGSNCRDIIINNGLYSYSRYAAILFGDQASRVDNILFNACSFQMNEQYETFSSYVHNRASHVEASFIACAFRNWTGFAIEHSAGSDVRLNFSSCMFDGRQTNPAYNGSTATKVISTSLDGSYRFSNCQFRNLRGEIARIGPRLTGLSIDGGAVFNAPLPRLTAPSGEDAKISIRNVEGFEGVVHDGTAIHVSLPWWGEATIWRLAVAGAVLQRGGGKRPFACELIASVNRSTDGFATCELTTIWATPAAANKALAPRIGFGDRPGGGARLAGQTSGDICISVGNVEARTADATIGVSTL